LPPSCVDCLKIREPQPPGTLKACNRIALPLHMIDTKVLSDKLQGAFTKPALFLVLQMVKKFYLDFLDPMHIKKLPLDKVINNYKNGYSAIWAALLLVVTRDCHCDIQSRVLE
jgi:hypothetical protein